MSEDPDRDCQVVLEFADGTVHEFPILRDRDMRWRGNGSMPASPLVSVTAEWFHNPPTLGERQEAENGS